MKGLVFTTFLEMVESKFSLEITDRIIETSELASGGSYTTLGTYDHNEIIRLVAQLSERTDIPVADLVRTFGEYLFGQLVEMLPPFVEVSRTSFDFLQKVDSYIHVEVHKLYPDAQLPRFEYVTPKPGVLEMTYRSSRPFADLAEGMIQGCIRHYGESIDIVRVDLPESSGTAVRFILTERV